MDPEMAKQQLIEEAASDSRRAKEDEHACHAAPDEYQRQAHAHHAHPPAGGALLSSAQATVHCLTGCLIGEAAGLAIGVQLGLPAWQTIILATALAFISGFALACFPLMRRENLSFASAFNVIWLGELISIAVMEIAMNAVDYAAGGMNVSSVAHPRFWTSLGLAALAGFLAAWPVNNWLLKRELKRCH